MPEDGFAPGAFTAEAITRRIFWLGGGGAGSAQMRKVAASVEALEPLTGPVRCAQGDWPVVCALAAIAVDLAIRRGDSAMAAALFDTTARLLELEARGNVVRPREAWDA